MFGTVEITRELLREYYPLISAPSAARLTLHDAYDASLAWNENPVLASRLVQPVDMLECLAMIDREG